MAVVSEIATDQPKESPAAASDAESLKRCCPVAVSKTYAALVERSTPTAPTMAVLPQTATDWPNSSLNAASDAVSMKSSVMGWATVGRALNSGTNGAIGARRRAVVLSMISPPRWACGQGHGVIAMHYTRWPLGEQHRFGVNTKTRAGKPKKVGSLADRLSGTASLGANVDVERSHRTGPTRTARRRAGRA